MLNVHHGMVEVYHGTAQCFEKGILSEGLKSFRQSGYVYFTSKRRRAGNYAIAWAIGLWLCDRMPSPDGIILALELPGDAEVGRVQPAEFSIRGSVDKKVLRKLLAEQSQRPP